MMGAETEIEAESGFGERVKRAVIWRSGSQIVAQLVAWTSTFMVIRLLEPTDYGLFAMTQVVLVFLNLMNGYGFANAVIRSESVTRDQLRQVFGMLLLLNGGLALAQIALAPLIAAYFRQPMVADLLMVQALLYFATPFIALPHALLSRAMDFHRPAQIHLVSAALGAVTAISCALAGWGVWTLVAAPMAIFYTQAIGMTWAARSLMRPSFRFAGSRALMSYGGTMMLVQFFWFIQSQSDVFIAGRLLDPHSLGIYTTGLFLTQILAAKFVPPLNEVAFAAYSRIQDRRDAMQTAFLKAVRLIMLIALPAYFGLAVTAEPFVLTFLGAKWAEAIPVVAILAAAMPLLTLQILFAPATNALGRPGIALKVAMAGTALLPVSFLIGVQWGIIGLAWGWVAGMSLLTIATAALSLPAIGIGARQLSAAVVPGLLAATAMAAIVAGAASLTAGFPPPLRLALLVPLGAAAYGGLLFLFARGIVAEVAALIRNRPAPAAAAAF